MTDQSTFEVALERRLAARAARADRPFDASMIASTAIETAPRRTDRVGAVPRLRSTLVGLAVVGMLTLVAAVAIGGALRPPPGPGPILLAIGASDGFRMRPIDGGDGLHIGVWPYFQPRWSPDGAYVAVTALTDEDANHLLVYRADGTFVMGQTGVGSELEWSPVRYDLAVQDIATNELHVISVEAGAIHAVLQPPGPGLSSTFSWAPDGSRIIVAVPSEGGGLGPAWILDPFTGAPAVRFGTEDASGLRGPRWSPDGLRVAAIERCPNGDCIRIRDAATGQRRSEVMSLSSPSRLAWSPDGAWLAFDSGGDLMVASADVETVTPLTVGPAVDRFVEWAPDGRSIVMWRTVTEGGQEPYQFWSVTRDGGGATLLANAAFGVSIQPAGTR